MKFFDMKMLKASRMLLLVIVLTMMLLQQSSGGLMVQCRTASSSSYDTQIAEERITKFAATASSFLRAIEDKGWVPVLRPVVNKVVDWAVDALGAALAPSADHGGDGL